MARSSLAVGFWSSASTGRQASIVVLLVEPSRHQLRRIEVESCKRKGARVIGVSRWTHCAFVNLCRQLADECRSSSCHKLRKLYNLTRAEIVAKRRSGMSYIASDSVVHES